MHVTSSLKLVDSYDVVYLTGCIVHTWCHSTTVDGNIAMRVAYSNFSFYQLNSWAAAEFINNLGVLRMPSGCAGIQKYCS